MKRQRHSMKRQHILAFSMVLGFLTQGAMATAQEVDETVLFATNSIHIKKNNDVLTGVVIVNDFSLGAVLPAGGEELQIDDGATVAGDVFADTVKINNGATLTGTVNCNPLGSSGATCLGVSLPVFGELPVFQQATVPPGAADVNVPDFATVVLDAGDYADVTTGRNATLVFTGGVYNIGSISAGTFNHFEFDAATELRILGPFGTLKNAVIGPSPSGSTATAASIILYVGASNIDPDDPSSSPRAATIGPFAGLEANFFVPNGTLDIQKNAAATGAFFARDIFVGPSGEFNLASSHVDQLPPLDPTPTAHAQSVQTNGTNPFNITLTGDDPIGGGLTFSIETSPTAGTLSGLNASTGAVTYTATVEGEPDSFTFRVTDVNLAFDINTVSINTVEPVENDPTPTGAVIARDDSLDVAENSELAVVVSGVADVADPEAVGDFTFSIVSGPSNGTLTPLTPAPIPDPPLPQNVRSAETTYTPNVDFTGSDSFDFQVCGDLNNDGDTLDPGECDTATVDLVVNAFTPPPPPVAPTAENLTVTTPEEAPVEINLSDENEDCAQGDTSCTPDPHPALRAPISAVDWVTLPGGPNLTGTNFKALEPDLIISSISHNPLEPIGFGSVTFTAIVKNDGDADAAASTLCFAIDALGEDCTTALFPVPLLMPGETHEEERTEDIAVGTGYQNTAVADINGVVAESDEQNNSATDTFGVGTPGTLRTATIEVLPTKGTVSGITATSNGEFVAITAVPTVLRDTMVIYTSDPLPIGVTEETDFFEYTLFDTSTGLTSIQGRVDLTITEVVDTCLANGREVACSPGQ